MNRNIRNIGIAAVGAAAATAVYALFVEPRWLQCTRTRMTFPHLPVALEGVRIALLTDLHASLDTPPRLIARAVAMTMSEHPDLIAITGDIAASEHMLEPTLDELSKLSAPLGVYIVPGNHDYRDVGIERWHDAVGRRRDLIDLTNSARLLEIPAGGPEPGGAGRATGAASTAGAAGGPAGPYGGDAGAAGGDAGAAGAGNGAGPAYLGNGAHSSGVSNSDKAIEAGFDDVAERASAGDVYRAGSHVRLCIAGVDDLAEGRPRLDALHAMAPRDFTILLAHNPDQAERARRGIDRVDLILSGHTHGGQVRLPGFGALVNSAEHADLYEAGVRRRPWTQVYTSRGIGTVHLPVRFLTRPEIAMITLSGAARDRERTAGWLRWLRPGGRSRLPGIVASARGLRSMMR